MPAVAYKTSNFDLVEMMVKDEISKMTHPGIKWSGGEKPYNRMLKAHALSYLQVPWADAVKSHHKKAIQVADQVYKMIPFDETGQLMKYRAIREMREKFNSYTVDYSPYSMTWNPEPMKISTVKDRAGIVAVHRELFIMSMSAETMTENPVTVPTITVYSRENKMSRVDNLKRRIKSRMVWIRKYLLKLQIKFIDVLVGWDDITFTEEFKSTDTYKHAFRKWQLSDAYERRVNCQKMELEDRLSHQYRDKNYRNHNELKNMRVVSTITDNFIKAQEELDRHKMEDYARTELFFESKFKARVRGSVLYAVCRSPHRINKFDENFPDHWADETEDLNVFLDESKITISFKARVFKVVYGPKLYVPAIAAPVDERAIVLNHWMLDMGEDGFLEARPRFWKLFNPPNKSSDRMVYEGALKIKNMFTAFLAENVEGRSPFPLGLLETAATVDEIYGKYDDIYDSLRLTLKAEIEEEEGKEAVLTDKHNAIRKKAKAILKQHNEHLTHGKWRAKWGYEYHSLGPRKRPPLYKLKRREKDSLSYKEQLELFLADFRILVLKAMYNLVPVSYYQAIIETDSLTVRYNEPYKYDLLSV